ATNLTSAANPVAASADAGIGTVAGMNVLNSQSVNGGANMTSTVVAPFQVSVADATTLTGSDVVSSTLSVSANSGKSTVTGNSASNGVDLSATNVSVSSALANVQYEGDILTSTISSFSGANATIGGDISLSSVAVDGNTMVGTTTGNTANNSVAVDGAAKIAAGDTTSGATANLATAYVATADHALANQQYVVSTLSTGVTATYNVVTLDAGTSLGGTISGSTLSVSNNVQSAKTLGNVAGNSVDLTGGSITTDSALASLQASTATAVGATSTMTVAAPASMATSTLALDGNANTATATVNTATNAMTVAADNGLTTTKLPATVDNASLSGTVAGYVATGDFVVNNAQSVSNAAVVTATATTSISNNDGGVLATGGIGQSSVSMSGNTTNA
ncbi:hypothetical protein GGQ88_004300, partial [Novosphingobium hassiacum]|nr:hypothetical protein [Novosphingobium hassiacum]